MATNYPACPGTYKTTSLSAKLHPHAIFISRILTEKVNTFVVKDFVEIGFERRFCLERFIGDTSDGDQHAVGISIECLLFRQPMFAHALPDELSIFVE
jgi:hypothetical protein